MSFRMDWQGTIIMVAILFAAQILLRPRLP